MSICHVAITLWGLYHAYVQSVTTATDGRTVENNFSCFLRPWPGGGGGAGSYKKAKNTLLTYIWESRIIGFCLKATKPKFKVIGKIQQKIVPWKLAKIRPHSKYNKNRFTLLVRSPTPHHSQSSPNHSSSSH